MTTPPNGAVRVRFAPSPTGTLHVGGARTAIFNELLARSLGGVFVLRIEDTDQARSEDAHTEQILASLRWLGVEWDEGPVFQSARLDRHAAAAARLLAEGKAYRAFETRDELDAKRRELEAKKEGFRYREIYAPLPLEEQQRRHEAGEPSVVRFRMPAGDLTVQDLVRGDVVFPESMLDDFVILRADGTPTYHLSVVVDDIDLAITHVLRGEDHLSNTPKHVGLFEALGAEVPAFAHVPLIHGADGRKLSKRHGAVSTEAFEQEGILPEALYNYLAFLGWSPGDDRELLSRDELIEAFTTDRLGGSASVFDTDKLAWMNAQYMSGLDLDRLLAHLEPFLADVGLGDVEDRERLRAAVVLHRGRARQLRQLAEVVVPYFLDEIPLAADDCGKFLKTEDVGDHVEALAERYAALDEFTIDATDAALRALADERGLKAGALIHPLRMGLTGEKAGPPVFDVVAMMGREKSVEHLRRMAAFLRVLEAEGESEA